MTSSRGQGLETPHTSGRGPVVVVEVPVASPRIKKRARKEQLLQQHKLFGKDVLDRISKAAVMASNQLKMCTYLYRVIDGKQKWNQ